MGRLHEKKREMKTHVGPGPQAPGRRPAWWPSAPPRRRGLRPVVSFFGMVWVCREVNGEVVRRGGGAQDRAAGRAFAALPRPFPCLLPTRTATHLLLLGLGRHAAALELGQPGPPDLLEFGVVHRSGESATNNNNNKKTEEWPASPAPWLSTWPPGLCAPASIISHTHRTHIPLVVYTSHRPDTHAAASQHAPHATHFPVKTGRETKQGGQKKKKLMTKLRKKKAQRLSHIDTQAETRKGAEGGWMVMNKGAGHLTERPSFLFGKGGRGMGARAQRSRTRTRTHARPGARVRARSRAVSGGALPFFSLFDAVRPGGGGSGLSLSLSLSPLSSVSVSHPLFGATTTTTKPLG